MSSPAALLLPLPLGWIPRRVAFLSFPCGRDVRRLINSLHFVKYNSFLKRSKLSVRQRYYQNNYLIYKMIKDRVWPKPLLWDVWGFNESHDGNENKTPHLGFLNRPVCFRRVFLFWQRGRKWFMLTALLYVTVCVCVYEWEWVKDLDLNQITVWLQITWVATTARYALL